VDEVAITTATKGIRATDIDDQRFEVRADSALSILFEANSGLNGLAQNSEPLPKNPCDYLQCLALDDVNATELRKCGKG